MTDNEVDELAERLLAKWTDCQEQGDRTEEDTAAAAALLWELVFPELPVPEIVVVESPNEIKGPSHTVTPRCVTAAWCEACVAVLDDVSEEDRTLVEKYSRALSCLCQLAYIDEKLVVSKLPTKIYWTAEHTLHRDGGPAVEWGDGWGRYALNGVRVPEWLAMTPAEQLDPQKIMRLDNVEHRREGIRKIGVERMVYSLGGKTLDSEGEYELLSMDLGDEVGEARALKMHNPSLPEVWHVEFVGPECQTVQDALNYRNGLTPDMIDDENGAEWYQQGDVIMRPAGAEKYRSRPSMLT